MKSRYNREPIFDMPDIYKDFYISRSYFTSGSNDVDEKFSGNSINCEFGRESFDFWTEKYDTDVDSSIECMNKSDHTFFKSFMDAIAMEKSQDVNVLDKWDTLQKRIPNKLKERYS